MLLRDLFEYQDLEAEKQNIIAKVSGLSAENEQDAARYLTAAQSAVILLML